MARVPVEFLAQRLAMASAEGHPTSNSTTVSGLDLTWVNNKALTYAAVLCAVICCFISFSDLREHLSRFDYPKLQVLEMRIILMVPIYAVFSALSLLFYRWRFFFETVRDTYESFVLYIFFMLMVSYCGGEGQLLRSLKKKRYKGMHPFPMCYLPSFPLDTDFYLRCKRWVLQCALIKPLASFVAMVCHPLGIYKEGSFGPDNVYTYACIVINVSLTMALYYLVLFEVECEKEMHYAKTFLKFLCIKSIIFFSYWQSVIVNLASSAGLIYLGAHEHEVEATRAVIQDLLMCFELLPVAFLHRAAFGRAKLDDEMACVPVYMKDSSTGDLRTNVDTALNVNDIIDDTFGTIFYRKGKLIDQENGGDSDDDAVNYGEGAGAADGGRGASRGPSAGAGLGGAVDELAFMGNADAIARDPTLEELVRHAIATDYGIRVDGVLHYDADSDREDRNQDMSFADTDVILHRSKKEAASLDVRVDTDLLRSHQVPQGGATPHIYCVVCGRFDRDMVRRRNGYKCKGCVGTKSRSLLRRHQQEVIGGGEGKMESRRGGRLGHDTAVVVETMDCTADFGRGER
ncbi:putative Organic solute transporter Ostalpha [Leishmania naiffi]|uniref:Organic solute transporter Ostalpha n=1 Tax=Leishmania naiffi TaxID=5678 RepID=A0AAW3C5C2_9TRYP